MGLQRHKRSFTNFHKPKIMNQSKQLRDAGIQQAVAHADNTSPGWSQRAYNAFVAYVMQLLPGQTFLTEDARLWAAAHRNLEPPPSERAWGAVAVKACREGVIRKAGYASVSNPKAHCTPATLWARF
jgi:hypothetical protein